MTDRNLIGRGNQHVYTSPYSVPKDFQWPNSLYRPIFYSYYFLPTFFSGRGGNLPSRLQYPCQVTGISETVCTNSGICTRSKSVTETKRKSFSAGYRLVITNFQTRLNEISRNGFQCTNERFFFFGTFRIDSAPVNRGGTRF